MKKPLVLALLIGDAGFIDGGWRLPESRVEDIASLDLFRDVAQRAEAAGIDTLFVADTFGLPVEELARRPTNQLEPLTLLAALSAITRHIGLIATASTTFSDPFTLARQLLSLDRMSRGRVGWNVVTSTVGEQHYGGVLPDHAQRYRRAAEFVDLVQRLWASWPDDAVAANRSTGTYAHAERLDDGVFRGSHFTVKGPLPSPASQQGRPVLAQAGSSPQGLAFGASIADLIFTMQPDLARAKGFAANVRRELQNSGRPADAIRILHGVSPILGATVAEARERAKRLQALIDIPTGLRILGRYLPGIDFSKLDLDRPVPPELLVSSPMAPAGRSVHDLLVARIVAGGETLRDLIYDVATARGHWTPVTTPAGLAEAFAERIEAGAADGFVFMPTDLDTGLSDLLDKVLPELKARGWLAPVSQSVPLTLRQRLALPDPSSVPSLAQPPEPVRTAG